MATLKYSRQREAIKSYLASTTSHPTADTVYMHVRDEFPNISLGTVYRNLNLLTDLGEAMKIVLTEIPIRIIISVAALAEMYMIWICLIWMSSTPMHLNISRERLQDTLYSSTESVNIVPNSLHGLDSIVSA